MASRRRWRFVTVQDLRYSTKLPARLSNHVGDFHRAACASTSGPAFFRSNNRCEFFVLPMLANIIVERFIQGGWIMWPILATAIVAVAVVGERIIWWTRESFKRDPERLEKILARLENAEFAEASKLAEGSEDPVIRTIWHGLNHIRSSLQ